MKLNLKAPSDLMGGLLIFGIAIAMFFVMRALYKPRALLGEGKTHNPVKKECEKSGGEWNNDPEDPCCKDPGEHYTGWVCSGGKKKGYPFNKNCFGACGNDPTSRMCENCELAVLARIRR